MKPVFSGTEKEPVVAAGEFFVDVDGEIGVRERWREVPYHHLRLLRWLFHRFRPQISLSLSLCFLFSLCVCVCVLVAFSFYRKKERKKERKVWLVLGNFFGIGFVIVWVRRLKEKNDGNMARGGPDLGLSWEGPWSFFFLLFIYFFLSFLKQIINLVL